MAKSKSKPKKKSNKQHVEPLNWNNPYSLDTGAETSLDDLEYPDELESPPPDLTVGTVIYYDGVTYAVTRITREHDRSGKYVNIECGPDEWDLGYDAD